MLILEVVVWPTTDHIALSLRAEVAVRADISRSMTTVRGSVHLLHIYKVLAVLVLKVVLLCFVCIDVLVEKTVLAEWTCV